MYLTPTRYRAMATGVNLSGRSDSEIASDIATAAAIVNSYCCVPVGHDFKGGTVTDEQHDWDPGTVRTRGTMRIFPYHRPLKAASSLVIDVTNNQHIDFTSQSLYVHKIEGWVEPVDLGLTAFGVFGYGILPNIGLHIPVAKVSYTYGWVLQAVDEVLGAESQTLTAANQFWTTDTVTVKKNGVVQSSGFTLNRYEGTITLAVAYVPGDVWTASYTYPLPLDIARATAMLVTEGLGAVAIASAGLQGLSGIKVEEVELRQSKASYLATGMSPAAAGLLAPYVVRSMA